jgi:branched-chain amino acid transport system permease protein
LTGVSLLLQQLFNGLSLASVYALVGIGITLVFGLTRLINFAHGELVMIGAVTVVALAVDRHQNFYLAVLVAIALVTVLSLVLERVFFRPTLASPLNGFIVSLGLILVLQGLTQQVWGPYTKSLVPPFPGVVQLGPLILARQRLFVIALAIPILVAFFLFLKYTRVGIGIRAAAVDPETASWMGVPVQRMIAVTFGVGGILAAIAGALIATLFPVNALIGGNLVIKGFAVALLGGLGNVAGALTAAVIIAVVETLVAGYYLAEWKDAIAFGIIVLVLLLRPGGLFRGTEGAQM